MIHEHTPQPEPPSSSESWFEQVLGLPNTPEARRRRQNRVLAPLAALATAGGLLAVVTPHTTESRAVAVSARVDQDGNTYGTVADKVCSEAADMIGAGFRKDQCEIDLAPFELPDGAIVTVRRTVQPVGLVDGRVALMVPGIETSLDGLRPKNQVKS